MDSPQTPYLNPPLQTQWLRIPPVIESRTEILMPRTVMMVQKLHWYSKPMPMSLCFLGLAGVFWRYCAEILHLLQLSNFKTVA